MNLILNFITSQTNSIYEMASKHPYASAALVVGATALATFRYLSAPKISSEPRQILENRLSVSEAPKKPDEDFKAAPQGKKEIILQQQLEDFENYPDLQTILTIAQEIKDLKPTIGDSPDYEFLATHKMYVDPAKTQKGKLSMQSAGMTAAMQKKNYGECPKAILQLGQALLRDRSGVCDHMAAAVIAKIVHHIKMGGSWNSPVELVGSGGHAYVVINRKKGDLLNPHLWGKGSLIVDSWLGCLGVNDAFKKEMTAGYAGVINRKNDIILHAAQFGALNGSLTCTHQFTVRELYELAGREMPPSVK